ncbi:MAG: phenylalanine--tRNA ligase subunit beta [Streptococcaceae bacterium]|jgi:phenylalanyl-tRNA synthetase beta chain|nr:phenylalanine--tRNA ligase subunit beta [Streptococcaceae bacterium]
MLVSYNWLKELVPDLAVSAVELGEKMSLSGIECEEVYTRADGLSKLVVGEIVSFEDVPETHLHVCQVSVGAAENLQIVCGAPNVAEGAKVIVALVGARIGGGTKIKKGKMRGFESQGMLCALDELGVDTKINPMKHDDGIYIFEPSAEVGADALEMLEMTDAVIDLDVLANRGDALSMRGVAHEVAAIYDLDVKSPLSALTETAKKAADIVKVSVTTDKVATYKIRMLDGVHIAPSPSWLQNRLMNMGVKPINNVVDVTNYVMLLFGQPLHAFDFAQFGADTITVREAKVGEMIETLDHERRALSVDDIVIVSNGRPVGLAGVMGGVESEITDATVTVALEAALFDSASIRKTSQRFSLRSEASARFEKGINEATVKAALDFAAALIAQLSGGAVLSGVVESNDYQPKLPQVSISLSRINEALGTTLALLEVEEIFGRLGFGVSVDGEAFSCEIPARRWDIHIEADLVEEIARIYGYDKLPTTLPASRNVGELTPFQKFRRSLRTKLERAGLSEIIGYSLTTQEKATEFTPGFETVALLMPMSEDRSTLRVNMLPGLLEVIAYNQARKNSDIAIYELGNVFVAADSASACPIYEEKNIAFAIASKNADYFTAKGIVERLLAGYENVRFEANADNPAFHPGRTAKVFIGDVPVAAVGQIHPLIAKKYDISETYAATLDMQALFELQPAQTIFTEIPKVQAVSRDIALLVDAETTHAAIVATIRAANVKTLTKVELFDIYQDENLPEGKKSMAYNLIFQPKEATMTEDEILSALTKITRQLTEKLHAEIR